MKRDEAFRSREEGYYWCRDSIDWEIAFWNSFTKRWSIAGMDFAVGDDCFDEIDERRIVRDAQSG